MADLESRTSLTRGEVARIRKNGRVYARYRAMKFSVSAEMVEYWVGQGVCSVCHAIVPEGAGRIVVMGDSPEMSDKTAVFICKNHRPLSILTRGEFPDARECPKCKSAILYGEGKCKGCADDSFYISRALRLLRTARKKKKKCARGATINVVRDLLASTGGKCFHCERDVCMEDLGLDWREEGVESIRLVHRAGACSRVCTRCGGPISWSHDRYAVEIRAHIGTVCRGCIRPEEEAMVRVYATCKRKRREVGELDPAMFVGHESVVLPKEGPVTQDTIQFG